MQVMNEYPVDFMDSNGWVMTNDFQEEEGQNVSVESILLSDNNEEEEEWTEEKWAGILQAEANH
jgi:hypothetical protein